ncbi:hypothetical protein DYB37_001607 [Aphanomyces astaci]|uniref:Phosphatidylinositol-3,4-bisphosphate 4-phosphatase n=1 Tax=Aphanomyces astaci TaxID=112090 RepID=A0A3R7F3Q6_APHAT|nr:hypothetical protein DYB37_001607 [Aphanomyces astaci]
MENRDNPKHAMNDDIFSLFGAPPAPVRPVEIARHVKALTITPPPPPQPLEAGNSSITCFLSCTDLHLPSVHTTAQTMLRGAMSVLGGASTPKNSKPPECMIQVDVKNAHRAPLVAVESLTTEKLRSRNPAFTVGIHFANDPSFIPPDSVVCFQVIMTEDSGSQGKKPVATAELAWLHLTQNYEHGASVVYLPLHCPYTDAGVLTIRFARTAPMRHPLLATQNQVVLGYAFPNANPSLLPTLVTEEMAEVGTSVQLPLVFLRQCRRELEGAYHLWRVRYNNAKKRLKHFADADEAMQSGCDVFRVSVLQARHLQPMKSMRKVPSKPLLSPKSFKKPGDGKAMDGGGGFESVGVHPFAVVLFNETPTPHANINSTPWQVVGKTNTEYECTAPTWATNAQMSQCPHGAPSTDFFVSTHLHTKVEKRTQFVWYRPSRRQELSGAIQIDVCSENETDGHQPPVALGSVTLSLEELRPLFVPDAAAVVAHAVAFRSANWFPLKSKHGDVVGEVQCEMEVRLTSAAFAFESERETHFQKTAKADETPLFRLATQAMDRALRDTMHTPSDDDTYSIQFLHAHVKELGGYVKELDAMIRKAEARATSKTWFKGSTDKKKRDIQAMATNLHVSYLRKFNWPPSNSPRPSLQTPPPHERSSQADLLGLHGDAKLAAVDATNDNNPAIATYATVTCGAPTAHAIPDEGLMELEDKLVKTHKEISLMANGMKNLYHGRVMVEGGNVLVERPLLVPVTDDDAGLTTHGTDEDDDVNSAIALESKPGGGGRKVTHTAKKDKKGMFFPKLSRQSSDTHLVTLGQLRERFESTKYQYYFRKSVCVSQSVTALVTTFLAMLELHEDDPSTLSQWSQIGFVIGWESLISSQGKEWRMLSDAWVAIKCLERFSFQLDHTISEIVLEERSVDHEGYIIRIPTKQDMHLGLIAVTPVVFTQGINEMQSLANMVGSSGVELQSTINNASFKSLQMYHAKYLKTSNVESDSTAAHLLLDPLMAVVQSENAAAKNTRILLEASDVVGPSVRRLRGGRVTYCKSGKDRTAMSVTLEQARLLFKRVSGVNPLHLLGATEQLNIGAEELHAANIMREFGIRIEIANKNVGRYKYSFNAIQRKMLPDIYRPPMSTIQDIVTSVTARDS